MRFSFHSLIVFIFFSFQAIAQIPIKSIPVTPSTTFTTDHFGNAYLIKEDELKKYDNNGNFIASYSNKSLGSISSVDVSNPLMILVFYKDFSQIVFLDNMLSLSNTISLAKYQLEQSILSCSSYNSGLWLYDQQSFQLIRLDKQLLVTQQTGDINQLLNMNIAPNFLMEYNNKVYLNNPATGLLVFDIYGTYKKTIPLYNLTSFQIKENDIYYYLDGKLQRFNMILLENEDVNVPNKDSNGVRIEKERMYLINNKTLAIYSTKK